MDHTLISELLAKLTLLKIFLQEDMRLRRIDMAKIAAKSDQMWCMAPEWQEYLRGFTKQNL